MTERWFKFIGIGCEDKFGFGTVDEAVELGAGDCTPYLLNGAEVEELGLVGCEALFRIRDALATVRPGRTL